jgi:hypothetical protein
MRKPGYVQLADGQLWLTRFRVASRTPIPASMRATELGSGTAVETVEKIRVPESLAMGKDGGGVLGRGRRRRHLFNQRKQEGKYD